MNPRQRFTVIPAVYIIFRDGDKVLLLRRADTGYRDGEYSLPAGHVDGGETAIAAACREAREEVGVILRPEDLRLVHTMHRRSTDPEPHERIDLFFEMTEWEGDIFNAEPEKCDELRWAKLGDLPDNVIDEVRQALDACQVGEPYSSFGF